MLVKDFLKERKSSREFREKNLASDKLIEVERELIKASKKIDGKIGLRLILDGESIFEELNGYAGYSGVMIKSPHYVSVMDFTGSPGEKPLLAIGMEECVSALSKLDLASCYITLSDVPSDIMRKVFGIHGDRVPYLIAFGEAKSGFLNLENPTNSRLEISEIVFKDEKGTPVEQEELKQRALDEVFYYVDLAPSYKNLQPWRFIVKDSEVVLMTKKSEIHSSTYVDLGIAMYYFEKLAELAGHRGKWKLSEGEILGDYEVIARYNL